MCLNTSLNELQSSNVSAVDLFSGAGGTGEGLVQACLGLGVYLKLTAINHNEIAIASHRLNHPGANYHCLTLEGVNPRTLFPEEIDLVTGSPECTHHSRAAGKKPKRDQSRATAWVILSWMQSHAPRVVLVENVPEFAEWGPLDEDGQPIQSQKGETFQLYLSMMRSLGYSVDYRILNAADFGDATCRRRLFIIAVKGKHLVTFPDASHGQPVETESLFTDSRPNWRTAREIIDWSLTGKSVFNRQKPMSMNTLRRISVGMERYWGIEVDLNKSDSRIVRLNSDTEVQSLLENPFLVKYYGNSNAQSLDEPLGTITTNDRFALIQPIIEEAGESAHRGIIIETPSGRFLLDLTLRMLSTGELAAAMSFPKGYQFEGTQKDIRRQIGNAVPVRLAEALTRTILQTYILPGKQALAA